jgi:hypothetical protein
MQRNKGATTTSLLDFPSLCVYIHVAVRIKYQAQLLERPRQGLFSHKKIHFYCRLFGLYLHLIQGPLELVCVTDE